MNCDWEMAGYGWSTDGVMTKERGECAALPFVTVEGRSEIT